MTIFILRNAVQQLVGFLLVVVASSSASASAAFVPNPRRAAAAAVVAPSTTTHLQPHHLVLVRLASTQWDFDNNNKNDDKTNKNSKDVALPSFDLSDASDKLQKAFKDLDFDMSSFSFDNFDLDKIKSNIVGDGQFGERGEAYFAAQAVIVLCVLTGGIPLVGDALMVLLGPGLLLSGLAVLAVSLKDLGSSLSPWPVPANEAELKTSGLYAYVRHPMYAGLLATCAGLSIVTGSATRLLLTAVLLYVLNVKSDYEEEQLTQTYSGYGAYKSQVTNKFFPQELLDQLPWVNNNKN